MHAAAGVQMSIHESRICNLDETNISDARQSLTGQVRFFVQDLKTNGSVATPCVCSTPLPGSQLTGRKHRVGDQEIRMLPKTYNLVEMCFNIVIDFDLFAAQVGLLVEMSLQSPVYGRAI